MRDDLHSNAQQARIMAEKFDSRVWHALADRLFEALDQADSMDRVITPAKP